MNVKGKSIREVMSVDRIDARQSKDVAGATGRSPLLARTRGNDILRINKKEVIIMRKLSTVTIAVMATIMVFWSVLPAEAIIIHWKFGMVGITMGQTARLNVVNAIDPNQSEVGNQNDRECMVELMFFDSEGNTLAETDFIIDDNKAEFHDLRFPANVAGRLQIRAVVIALGGPDTKCKNVIPTLEIYNNETLKTEVFADPPEPN